MGTTLAIVPFEGKYRHLLLSIFASTRSFSDIISSQFLTFKNRSRSMLDIRVGFISWQIHDLLFGGSSNSFSNSHH